MADKTKTQLEAELAQAEETIAALRDANNTLSATNNKLLAQIGELDGVGNQLQNLKRENRELRATLEAAREEIALSPKLNPELAELVREKRAAGLSARDALEVAQRQIEKNARVKKEAEAAKAK